MQNKNHVSERQSSFQQHQNLNTMVAPVTAQTGPIINSPSKLNFNQNQKQNTISKSVNDGATSVPFVGNGLNMVSIAEKVAIQGGQKGQTQQQMTVSLNVKSQNSAPNQQQAQKQAIQLQSSQLLSRASQNNQKFVANFGRRAMVPLQPGANGQNVIMIGGGLNGAEMQFAQLQQQQPQVHSQPRENSNHQLQNNIFLDANFNNFVCIQQQASKGGNDNLVSSMQINTSNQASGTQSFRIPSQEKSFQSNEHNVTSSGVVLRPQNHVKQVYLPFIQTPKQHHVGSQHQKGGLTINGKQQLTDEQHNVSIFKDIQSQKMSIAHNGQLIPSGQQTVSGMYMPQKFPSQKYERVKQFDQAVSHGFTPQTTQTSQNSVATGLTGTSKSQNVAKNGQVRSESTDYYLSNQQHIPNLVYIGGIDSEQNASLNNVDQTTNSTFNDGSMNLLGAAKSPFVKQYAMTEKKKKMSFSQQGPYRAVGYVQQPIINLGNQVQSQQQNSIFNSKKNVVSITGDQFILQSSEYLQKNNSKELSQQSRQNQGPQTIIQASVRLDNNTSKVNLQQLNTRNAQQIRENHANNTQQLQSANLTKFINNNQQAKQMHEQHNISQKVPFTSSSPQKPNKSHHVSNHGGHSSKGDRNGRGASASKLIKPSLIDTKNFPKNHDYSPNSAQLQFHSSTRQNGGGGIPFDGIQIQLITASDYQMQMKNQEQLQHQQNHQTQKNKFASLSHGSDGSQIGNGLGGGLAKQQTSQDAHDGEKLNHNTMHMFYGDYDCYDEPEEDDQSNQQMSGSQFSDDIDERADDEEVDSDVDSPVRGSERANDGARINSRERPQVKKKMSSKTKDSMDPSQKMTDNHELMEQIANQNGEFEMGAEQMKFLDMLQQSKLKKNGSMRPLKLNNKNGSKNKRQKNKSQNQNRTKTNQRLTEINEGDESNDDGLAYHSDTQSKNGKDVQEEAEDENLKNLILKIETPKITSDMTKKEIFLKRPPSNKIVLNYGPIPGRAPTIFFNYPPFLKMQRPFKPDRIQIITQDQLQPYSYLSFRISSQTHTYNCVVNALKTAGFHLVNRGQGPTSWNILWAPLIRPSKLRNMNPHQKINHFAGAWGLGSKANLWRNVQKQRRKHGKDFEICPITYIFPEDYKRWINDREMNNFKDMYIFKPTSASCGKGIKVIGRKDTVPKRAGYLVSKYIAKPHLLRGYKYDLRIYILVTCFEPLKAYIFREGLVRLATQPYTTNKNSLKKRFVHLTNYSVNKKAENYSKNKKTDATQIVKQICSPTNQQESKPENNNDEEEEEMESKWSLKMLREEFEKMGIDYAEIYSKIKDVCIKTLMSVEPYIVTQNRTAKSKNACFEIYGFDVLIDANLKPWLLEVNVLPSLSSSSPFDKQVKSMLLSDSFHLLGFNIFDRKQILESKKLENKKKLMGGIGAQNYHQNAPQTSQIYKSQKLRTQGSIQDSPYKVMDTSPVQTFKPSSDKYRNNSSLVYSNANAGADNTTASTGVSANSGASSNVTPGLPTTKQKQRYMQSPQKTKKGEGDPAGGSYTYSRPQMLHLGASDYQEKSLTSPEKIKNQASPEKFKILHKVAIASFLQGFEYLTEDDLEILATYEEEQARRQQTQFDRLFPTRDTIESLGKHFECQRHANNLIWQYIRQKCPSQPLKNYYRSNPQI